MNKSVDCIKSGPNESTTKDNNSVKTKGKLRGKKRKRPCSETSSEPSSEHDVELPENAADVDRSLHAVALKNNLDETSVRKIIKKVVTNDRVLALVKMREEEDSGPEERPKLTRAKVKELMKVSPKTTTAWNLENLELTPIKHIPVKTRPEVKALIAQELPEDEDDEEYEPTHDDVPSDDDQGLESCSDLDSQPRTPATPRSQHAAKDEDEESLGKSIIKISKKELNDLITELFNVMPESTGDEALMAENLSNSVFTDNSQTEKLSEKITFEKKNYSKGSGGKGEPVRNETTEGNSQGDKNLTSKPAGDCERRYRGSGDTDTVCQRSITVEEKRQDGPEDGGYTDTNPAWRVFQHKLLSFSPQMSLYEHPEHEVPRIWLRYLAKTSKRFRSYLMKRTHSTGVPSKGIEINIGQVLNPPAKDPLPIGFTNQIVTNCAVGVTTPTPQPEKFDIQITQNSEQPKLYNHLYKFVETSTGPYLVLMPSTTHTYTVNTIQSIITTAETNPNVITEPSRTSQTTVVTDHCTCCILLRKICKEKQTLITDFFGKKIQTKCGCKEKRLPRISNKLKLLVNVSVTKFQLNFLIRTSMARNPSIKRKIYKLLQTFNLHEHDPVQLALNLDKVFGNELVDLYKEFIGFLTPEQADKIDAFKDYFISQHGPSLPANTKAQETMCEDSVVAEETTTNYEADQSMSDESDIGDSRRGPESHIRHLPIKTENGETTQYVTPTSENQNMALVVTVNKTEVQEFNDSSNSSRLTYDEGAVKIEGPEWKRDEDKLILEILKEHLSPEERQDKTILELFHEKNIVNIIAESLTDKSTDDITTRMLYLLQLC
ncbi:hypothetical protein HF086_002398 [Spodoptera exigua]|uniref:Uncharacterized protein n=1 Tax=Spodoptera exigua TaxID=7107 RepID=A0A922SGA4_SPOEX|nr:hypothetical protein HF086_002398 [Spodoptera exigua]